ncbi:MAG: DNA polymerase/3'-5' exonuclease PolX, partial [bacterium]
VPRFLQPEPKRTGRFEKVPAEGTERVVPRFLQPEPKRTGRFEKVPAEENLTGFVTVFVETRDPMPIHNSDVTSTLNTLADLLEIQGANTFRVRAYREAARAIDGLPRSVAEMVSEQEDLGKLPGIGKSMAEKIHEIVETGSLRQLEELKQQVPGGLGTLLSVPGLGPKRVKEIHEYLGVTDAEGLAEAARQGRIRALEGLGAKTEQKILEQLRQRSDEPRRLRRPEVEEVAEDLVDYLRGVSGVKRAVIAGSYRRRKETVGDVDILVTCKRDSPVMERFVSYEDVEEVVSRGSTRSTVRMRSKLQVDLRVVAEVSYGAALHYFTGSKSHNIAIRKIGMGKQLKINEYGVFRGDERIAGRTETEVYTAVGLPYIEPELREDRGEIEAAQQGSEHLPKLIRSRDLRGDLHSHTKASDGKHTLREMAEAAQQRGYDYLAITEHSKRLTVTHGLDETRLRHQMTEIDKLNETLQGFRLLKGIEVDILDDGSLDLDDTVLAELDLVVCSIHSKFDLSAEKQTERVIRAMDNPYFNILAHPSGRMLGQRDPHGLDIGKAMEAALERGCFLELNSQPDRLDLTDSHCKLAKDLGLKVAVSTDSHTTAGLDVIRYGLDQARRGWLEPDDVLNTRRWNTLKKLLTRN